jgi:heat shock protein HspQ
MSNNHSENFEEPNFKTNILVVSPQFNIGDIVKHKLYQFRGVIIDIDPEFGNTDEWYESIPVNNRPRKDQPFYHLLAENSESFYSAYVSQQNLISDSESGPVNHPDISDLFTDVSNGRYVLRDISIN